MNEVTITCANADWYVKNVFTMPPEEDAASGTTHVVFVSGNGTSNRHDKGWLDMIRDENATWCAEMYQNGQSGRIGKENATTAAVQSIEGVEGEKYSYWTRRATGKRPIATILVISSLKSTTFSSFP